MNTGETLRILLVADDQNIHGKDINYWKLSSQLMELVTESANENHLPSFLKSNDVIEYTSSIQSFPAETFLIISTSLQKKFVID